MRFGKKSGETQLTEVEDNEVRDEFWIEKQKEIYNKKREQFLLEEARKKMSIVPTEPSLNNTAELKESSDSASEERRQRLSMSINVSAEIRNKVDKDIMKKFKKYLGDKRLKTQDPQDNYK